MRSHALAKCERSVLFMTASQATRTVVSLVQARSETGDWNDTGEFGVGKSRGVRIVAESILRAYEAGNSRNWRIIAWDTWTVEQLLGCAPYPEHDHPAAQLAWIQAIREHVPPHAEVTSTRRS